VTTLAGSGVIRSATAAPARGGGVDLLPRDTTVTFALAGAAQDLGRVEPIKVTGRSFERALRLTTTTTPGVEWNLYLTAPTAAPIRSRDVLLARFWLRCNDSMTGEGFTTFTLETLAGESTRVAEFRAGAGAEWREFSVPFRVNDGLGRGHAHVRFSLGFDRQTIDLGGVELLNCGADADLDALPRTVMTYAGRQPDAPWRAAALKRIEEHRKGNLSVRVTDATGKGVPHAKVRMTLRRHAFGFGSAVTVEHLLGNTADAQRYREIVERYFNIAVFENDMKWPENYGAARSGLNTALDWLLARGIRVRGHNLIWPSWKWLPEGLRQHATNADELRLRTHLRITQAVGRHRGKLVHWDVINEPYSEHDLMDILGQDVMVEWFKLAKQADPQCQMYLNDYGIFDGGPSSPHRKHFYETIGWLKGRGAPIDGIGIQSHFGALPAPPERMLAVLDQFSEFGLPIESTELSLNMLDRELQADFMRDYLIALFSHPNVHGIMLWGFWEGRHWRPDAAMFERDWTPRPMADAWIDLVHKEWKTDVTATTNADGVAHARGFCGDYDINVAAGSASAHAQLALGRSGSETSILLSGGA
jgi:endo-1,4-beta-xylanase